MPSRRQDTATELAEKMVTALRTLRGQAGYPVPLRRLAQLADPAAEAKTILAAVHPQKRAFQQHAVVARKDLDAPATLLEDLAQLAASSLLLEFGLVACRTPANQAFSLSELKAKLTTKLQKPFQEAVQRQLQEQMLPESVAWILIRNTKKLFLLKDLHTRGHVATPAATPQLQDFATAFGEAFQQLDRQAGGHNFVSLLQLRQALPFERETFDTELRKLRIAGQYTLSAAEGRHGVTPAEQEGGILENGSLLLYVSWRQP